jgi:hypothetical protein
MLLVVAIAVSATAGSAVATALMLALAAVVLVLSRRLSRRGDERFVLLIVALALAARLLLVGVLDIASRSNGGALFLDDASYLRLASQVSEAWRSGVPASDIDPTQGGNYVKFAAGLFFLFGSDAVLLKYVNTAFGVMAALLVYRTMVNLRVPGPRVALVLTLFFPSLVLWSALALKDAYVLFFTCAAVWTMSEYARSRRFVPWYLLAVASMVAVENVRAYMYVILVVAWPLAMPFVLRRQRWMGPSAIAAALAAILLATSPALTYLNPNIVTISTFIRQAMAVGARTSLVEPLPAVRGEPGDRFVVTAVDRSPVPAELRRTLYVRPGDPLVLEGAIGGAPPNDGETVVRPGDTIVIAAPTGPSSNPGSTELPAGSPLPILLAATGHTVVGTPAPSPADSADSLSLPRGASEAIRYLPVGITYVIGAPNPLTARTLSDIATIPEMLMWYGAEFFAAWGLILLMRARRYEIAYGLLIVAGVGLVLSLFEGNAGTLLRHRAMMIPWVAVLAAAGGSDFWSRVRARRAGVTLESLQ